MLQLADCGRNQTRGARALDRKASDSIVAVIGIDIGKTRSTWLA